MRPRPGRGGGRGDVVAGRGRGGGEATPGYPYFVQLYGDAVWQVPIAEAGAVLNTGRLTQAETLVEVDTPARFRARRAKATPGEQRLPAALSRFDDGPVRRAEPAAQQGVAGERLNVQRPRLSDKGLIENVGRDTTPGFAAFRARRDRRPRECRPGRPTADDGAVMW